MLINLVALEEFGKKKKMTRGGSTETKCDIVKSETHTYDQKC
jgi:hypothetical protein